MQATLEEIAKYKVKLTVEVPPDELKPTLDLAYRHLAESVKIPGFRKGRAPRPVIEAQLGREAIVQEFLEHAVPTFYVRALREHDLAPIGDPDFDDLDVSDIEGAGFRFTATVEIRPRIRFDESEYKGLVVERPPAEVAEADVDEQLDRLRDRFAELETVAHPARRGDYVVADIRGYVHDQEVPEATGQDLLYEIGSDSLVPKLDEELEGKRSGDILKFNATLPERFGDRAGEEVTFQVLVKEVKAKHLSPLDDEFAKTASEFDTLDELRTDIREKLGVLKAAAADAAVRDRVLEALLDRVDVELPERLVDEETQARVDRVRERAERQGVTFDRVLAASNIDELQFRSDARTHAIRAIKADLALEAVARAAGIDATDDEIEEAVAAIARDAGRDSKEVRRILEQSGRITSVAGDIIRTKALDLVVEHAEVKGGAGPTVPPTEGKKKDA